MKKITKIGMVVAMDKEVKPFLAEMGELSFEKVGSYEITSFTYNGIQVYLLKSGIGEIFASAGTQLLITKYGVELILNFGVCGSLTKNVSVLETVFVNGVVHYDFDLSPIDNVKVGQYPNEQAPVIYIENDFIASAIKNFPSIKTAICASADKFVVDESIKQTLNNTFKATVCDMECAGVLFTANNNNVPCIIIKAVSDGEGGAEEFNRRVYEASKAYINVFKSILNGLGE